LEEIEELKSQGITVLSLREIESYLLEDEIIEKLCIVCGKQEKVNEDKVIKMDRKKKHENNVNKAALVLEKSKANITKSESKTKSKGNLKIEDVVEIGPKGVTNKQMIPAIQKAIEEGSKEKINLLKQNFPVVYEGSLKYIKKNLIEKLNSL
jgi:arginase family enzyme